MLAGRAIRPGTWIPVFAFLAAVVFLTHASLLNTPFYWDELGQFVPASLDLFQLGDWVPVTTVPNIHPPGVMAYLAAFWHITGYSVTATRVAMLLLAAVGAIFTFSLAIKLTNERTGAAAVTAVLFLCLSPLFVAQAMMAQLDMPAMVFGCAALWLFLQENYRWATVACVALVLVKETGIVAPAVFGLVLLIERRWKDALLFTAPLAPLGVWLWVLHRATGHWAGNESFAAYNAVYSLHPVRFALALTRRLYYLFVGTGHWVGTAALFYAWRHTSVFRSRGWRVTALFAAVHVLCVSLFGGAVLERYLMPLLPPLYIAFAVGFWSLSQRRRILGIAALAAMLAVANFVNPLYPFPFENNLAYVSFSRLNRRAAEFVEHNYPGTTVTTTFPMAGALRRPDFGYVSKPMKVREIDNFEGPAIGALAKNPPETMVVYSVAWDPLGLLGSGAVSAFLHRFYGYEPQVAEGELADSLHMHATARWTEAGQWIEVLRADPPLAAKR